MLDPIIQKGCCVVAAIGKTTLPPIGVFLAEVSGLIDDKTAVPLSLVAAIGGGCWYLSSRLTQIEDSIKELRTELENKPCAKCDKATGGNK
jgi:hypothetical protein